MKDLLEHKTCEQQINEYKRRGEFHHKKTTILLILSAIVLRHTNGREVPY